MSLSLFSPIAQSSMGSDWNWLVVFIIFVVVLAIALIIQARFSKHDAAEYEHHEEPAPPEEVKPAAAAVAAPAPKPEPDLEPEPAPEAAAPTEMPAAPDDLKKLEGIGPKVSGLLNENGITTFAQLADTPVEKLNELLDAHKLQMMEPKSWPRQAKLAAEGDWDGLSKLQDELKGGR